MEICRAAYFLIKCKELVLSYWSPRAGLWVGRRCKPTGPRIPHVEHGCRDVTETWKAASSVSSRPVHLPREMVPILRADVVLLPLPGGTMCTLCCGCCKEQKVFGIAPSPEKLATFWDIWCFIIIGKTNQ